MKKQINPPPTPIFLSANKVIPKNYQEGIPRVSEIVEYVFPFDWEDKERFLKWLKEKWVDYNEYMDEASTWGSAIHKWMENFIKKKKLPWKSHRYKNYILNGIKFLKDNKVKAIAAEKYVVCDDYQWTVDLVAKIGKKTFILDWKSYSMSKDKFKLSNKYTKPYAKLKKASLQLSLYAKLLKIDNIWVIELRKDGFYFHILNRIPDEELDKIIEDFKNNKK